MSAPVRPGPALRVRIPGPSPAVRRFISTEAGSAALLLAATVLALVWANSPWSDSYADLWSTRAAIGVGDSVLDLDLHTWVNDAAMALFFLVVGLEIMREVRTGELRDRRAVAVPALGALGGLAVPALIYLAFNAGGEAQHGWGIVMSTDTAFVVGILALFGPRCPERLRLFLLTLAIVDDIGAITVMAVFYNDGLDLGALAVAGVLVAVICAFRWLGVWRLAPYAVVGIALWLAVHASGVHATLAGVLVGLLVPASSARRREVERLPAFGRALVEEPTAGRARVAALAASATVAPNARLTELVHPWSAYVVVPVFGLANAGVPLDGESLEAAAGSPVTIGVIVALVLGNAVGITTMSYLALRSGWGLLPGRVRYSHLLGGAALAGIGFTISLFIAELAFDDEHLVDQAKIGILAGSLIAAMLGTLLLRTLGERSSLCTPGTDELPTLPPRPWREPAR
jgi:NhaA family Na+:H+ antiporter